MKFDDSLVYENSNTGIRNKMAMFVSHLPVGMPRSELEKRFKGVRSARAERDWITKRSLWTEYKY